MARMSARWRAHEYERREALQRLLELEAERRELLSAYPNLLRALWRAKRQDVPCAAEAESDLGLPVRRFLGSQVH